MGVLDRIPELGGTFCRVLERWAIPRRRDDQKNLEEPLADGGGRMGSGGWTRITLARRPRTNSRNPSDSGLFLRLPHRNDEFQTEFRLQDPAG